MNAKKVVIVSSLLAAAVVGGSVSGVAVASATFAPPAHDQAGQVLDVESFAMADSGLTYGFVDQGLTSDPAARPDLVLVTTDEGIEGWAYSDELMPWLGVKTPEEAKALDGDVPYAVPVYELDGETLLGFQTVNRPPAG